MAIPLPINGPSFAGRSGKVNASRTINWHPQSEKPGSRSTITLYPDPGLKPLQIVGVGPCRVTQGVRFLGRLYFVSGPELVSFDEFGNGQSHGSLTTTEGHVKIIRDRVRMIVLDGADAFGWDGTTWGSVFTADNNFPKAATEGTVLNNQFIVAIPDSDQFIVSLNGTAWNPSDVATAEINPDIIVAVTRDRGNLVLIGEDTTELWTGVATGVGFARLPGGGLNWGCQSARSVFRSSVGVFMLAKNEEGGVMVVVVSGVSVTPISDDINWMIGEFDTSADAIGFGYQQRGRWYYQLTFPTADKTFVYNVTEKMWHERKSYGIGRHRIQGHGFIANTHIVGDFQTGQFYELDFKTYTDNNDTIERIRVTSVIEKNNDWIAHDQIILVFDGEGDLSVNGRNPVCRLRFSDDGGNLWSDSLEAEIGQMGDYNHVAVFNRLGASRARIYEIKVTEPVPLILVKGFIEAEGWAQ